MTITLHQLNKNIANSNEYNINLIQDNFWKLENYIDKLLFKNSSKFSDPNYCLEIDNSEIASHFFGIYIWPNIFKSRKSITEELAELILNKMIVCYSDFNISYIIDNFGNYFSIGRHIEQEPVKKFMKEVVKELELEPEDSIDNRSEIIDIRND